MIQIFKFLFFFLVSVVGLMPLAGFVHVLWIPPPMDIEVEMIFGLYILTIIGVALSWESGKVAKNTLFDLLA